MRPGASILLALWVLVLISSPGLAIPLRGIDFLYDTSVVHVTLADGRRIAAPLRGQGSMVFPDPLGTPGPVSLFLGDFGVLLVDVPPFHPNFTTAIIQMGTNLFVPRSIDSTGRIAVDVDTYHIVIQLRCLLAPGCFSDGLPDILNESALDVSMQLPDLLLSPLAPGDRPFGANTGTLMLESTSPIQFSIEGFDVSIDFRAVEFVSAPEPRGATLIVVALVVGSLGRGRDGPSGLQTCEGTPNAREPGGSWLGGGSRSERRSAASRPS